MGVLGVIVIALFILLALLRVPVWVALLAPALAYSFLTGQPVIFSATNMVRALDSFTFLAIPLFIYVGSLMNHGGSPNASSSSPTASSATTTAASRRSTSSRASSSRASRAPALADIGGVGRVLIKSMTDADYDADFSAAVTSASATVGPIFRRASRSSSSASSRRCRCCRCCWRARCPRS